MLKITNDGVTSEVTVTDYKWKDAL